MNKLSRMTVIAGLFCFSAIGVNAHESPRPGIRAVEQRVRFDDLNIARPAGAATLHWRLRVAANNVCVKAGQPRFACRRKALDRALSELPAGITAYHAQWVAKGSRWLELPQSQLQLGITAAR